MGPTRISDQKFNFINTTYQAPISPLSPSSSTDASKSASQAASTTAAKPTVNLFDQSSYHAPAAVTLTNGSTVTLPTSTPQDAETFQTLFANMPDEHKANINAASSNLAAAMFAYVQNNPETTGSGGSKSSTSDVGAVAIANAIASANTSRVGGAANVSKLAVGGVSKLGTAINGPSTQSSATVADAGPATTYTISQASPDVQSLHAAAGGAASAYQAGKTSGSGNYDETVQAVAYIGVQGLQQSLGNYASQMQTQINNQNTVRTDQNELSSAVADWPSGATTQTFTFHDVDANGNLQTYTENLTQDQAKSQASNLSNTLSSMGDDTQMMQTQLQNMEQNYQQGVTTISNLMKMQYDMVKNTIGNIHY